MKKSKAYLIFARWRNGHKTREKRLRYYTSIDDISLFNFAKCCNGELMYLSRTGKIKKDARQVWRDVVLEYNEQLTSLKDIAPNIQMAQLIAKVRILEASMDNELTNDAKRVVRMCGVRLTGNNEQNTAILYGRINALIRELHSITAEIKTEKKHSDTIKVFSEILCSMSAYYKVHLDIKSISVREYCSWMKRYTNEIKELQKRNDGRGINK